VRRWLWLWLALSLSRVALAQSPCPDPVTTEWDLAPAGCTRSTRPWLADYECDDAPRLGVLATATAVPTTGLDCASLPRMIAGRALTGAGRCEVVDGIAFVETSGTEVALRAHPETHRLLEIDASDRPAQLRTIARAIAPRPARHAGACTADLSPRLVPLLLEVPPGAWTTTESAFERTSFVVVDVADPQRWLRFEVAGGIPFQCGTWPGHPAREIEIGGSTHPAEVDGDVVRACVDVASTDGPGVIGVQVSFPSSDAGTAWAMNVIGTARAADGWTLSSFRPRFTLARWAADVRVRRVLGPLAFASVIAFVLAVRGRRRKPRV
jgi:hypothetical protein